jgi:hypothetical protein
MRRIIITIFAILTTNCYAGWESWSDTDRKLFVASQIAITADWATTRYGVRNRDNLPGLRESNIILGPYPSTDRLDLYFVVMLVSNYYIADIVPDDDRKLYLTVRTVSHGLAARHNVQAGWQLRF